MAKTATPTAIALSRNSIWTLQDLQNLPLSRSPKTDIYLQAIARQLKIPTRRVPKSELIEKIIQACSSYRRTTHTITPTTDREIHIHKIATSFYQNEGEKLGFYNYIKKCIILGITNSNSSPEFNRLLVIFRPTLESHLRDKGDYTDTTLQNYKSDVLKLLESWLDNDFFGHDWKPFYDTYKRAIDQGFKDVVNRRKKQTQASVIARQEVTLKIYCCPAILEARQILSSLKNSDKRRWRHVVWALMLATGRRPSEILCTGQFQTTGNDHQVLFSGQLQKHGEESAPYPIPTLVSAKLVVAGMKWLENHGKRDCDTPAQVNIKYANALSERVKELNLQTFKVEEGTWSYTDNGKDKSLNNSQILRHVYGVVCSQIFNNTQPLQEYLAAILGHKEISTNKYDAGKTYSERVLIDESTTALQKAIFN